MKVLAIDSSGLTATVAVVEDEQTTAEYTVNYKKTHSQTLLPMIDEIVRMAEVDLTAIDAIAGGRRSRVFYWASHWLCHGKGVGACHGQTADPRAVGGCYGVQCVRM